MTTLCAYASQSGSWFSVWVTLLFVVIVFPLIFLARRRWPGWFFGSLSDMLYGKKSDPSRAPPIARKQPETRQPTAMPDDDVVPGGDAEAGTR